MENKIKKEEGYFGSERQDMVEYVPKESRKILDVGCGEGNFAFLVKTNFNHQLTILTRINLNERN